MTRDITSVLDEALLQARGCLLESQATEAGYLFGSDLVDSESGQHRQSAIHTALADGLAETAPGSYARAFMIAVLSALDDRWEPVS